MSNPYRKIAKFDVTQECIEDGKRDNPYSCPVALGGQRGEYLVIVHADHLFFRNEQYGMTPELRGWVRKYDHEEAVQPITVSLFMQDGTRFAGISKG